ncbi:GntR family transcriptional regulator [Edaphobacter aggregans]|uniref:GntR family transcriptional regulator n=2 Tax=Edaphobacter aggregans TaxID=570835 RepID=A0A3R9P6X1_9BACT|nr:GntR family transcriptional regulator [Edaphobacter aggregans]
MSMPKTPAAKSKRASRVTPNPETFQDSTRMTHGTTIEIHRSTRDRIRLALLKRISEGTYLPGERLKELALANEFEVSQAPVREAFRELEALGVLVSEHYRGTRVREISTRETKDVYQLRGYLEEIAAQLIPLSKLQEEMGSIEAQQMIMRTAARSGDLDRFARANVQFHRSIVGLASNQILPKIWDSLEIGMRSRLNLQKNEDRLLSLAEIHQPIVDTLKLGDLKRTGVLLREHAFSFLDNLP